MLWDLDNDIVFETETLIDSSYDEYANDVMDDIEQFEDSLISEMDRFYNSVVVDND